MNLTQNLNSTKDAKLYKLKINYKIIFVELSTIFYMLMEDLHGSPERVHNVFPYPVLVIA